VSNLHIPGYERPWEQQFGAPARIASALEIMLEGPIGAASFNNEFGRRRCAATSVPSSSAPPAMRPSACAATTSRS